MTAFLRLPPFPGHRAPPLARTRSGKVQDETEATNLIGRLREARVGGEFWLPAEDLPGGRDIILAPANLSQMTAMAELARLKKIEERAVWWGPTAWPSDRSPKLDWPADPWSIASQSSEVWAGAGSELAAIACITGTRLVLFKDGSHEASDGDLEFVQDLIGELVLAWDYFCPFSGSPIAPSDVIDLLADFRRLIESNRQFAAVLGVARWKRSTLDPLLWDGTATPRYARRLPKEVARRNAILAWRSRTPQALLRAAETSGAQIAELEDGLIRSSGLGANCVPPLSCIVDRSGVYFDPAGPSDLEIILETWEFPPPSIERARQLRSLIVGAGLGKYGRDDRKIGPSSGTRRVLVVGQVENDRSVISGGGSCTNLELLRRARDLEPDAWIIYRPHPDVSAGHRPGFVSDQRALEYADEVAEDVGIGPLIDSVNAVHCITSLAGFEALMREKEVTTHGVPFYAGWGLTRDLGPIPSRRSRRRTIDELVAGALIEYPRYIDPLTCLPCPPEVLVDRIISGQASVTSLLTRLRQWQGRLNVAMQSLKVRP
jgi:capsular polysaccharide export protein